MRKKKKEESVNTEAWMATYSDLVTLLLCFFVLLYSFSEVDVEKFEKMMNSFHGSIGVLDGGKTMDEQDGASYNNANLKKDNEAEEIEDFLALKRYIEAYAQVKGLEDEIKVTIEERGLMVRVLDNVFFDSGKADIKPRAREIILYIGEVLNKNQFLKKHIKVEGHTDNVKMNSVQFPSNWELSVRRATNVLRILESQRHIDGNRISASGYGPNRPIAPNDTPENKAKNRRVDIVVLKSTYSKYEP